MTRIKRIQAEAVASWRSFVRRRTAVFFTFGFPLILVAIFGVVVQTDPTEGGIFGRPVGYYVAGYLAVIVLFTPLSRVGSTIARYRDKRRFEKLATTPLGPAEWLFAHALVNTAVILLASGLVLAVLFFLTDASITLSPLLLPFVVAGVFVFVGFGAVLGRLAGSQDGVIAASNGVALPLVFLSETFIESALLPEWLQLAMEVSPLTYFARGVRAVTHFQNPALLELTILSALAVAFFAIGARAVPTGQ